MAWTRRGRIKWSVAVEKVDWWWRPNAQPGPWTHPCEKVSLILKSQFQEDNKKKTAFQHSHLLDSSQSCGSRTHMSWSGENHWRRWEKIFLKTCKCGDERNIAWKENRSRWTNLRRLAGEQETALRFTCSANLKKIINRFLISQHYKTGKF